MSYVMEMSTDADIINTQLNSTWHPISARYNWTEVSGMNLTIPNASTIIIIAHGDGKEIGNAVPGTIDINAETFLALIQGNMADGSVPNSIYISTCGPGIAAFAAGVRMAATNNQIWEHTHIFGHSDPLAGDVPSSNDVRWTQIF